MSRIGKKLLVVFLSCIVFTVASISIIAMISSKNIVATIMASHTESGVETIEYDIDSEVDNLKIIFSSMDGFDYTVRASAANAKKAWDNLKRSNTEFAAFASTSGEIYWQSDNFNLADFSATKLGTGYSGVVLDSSAGLTIQYVTTIRRSGSIVGYAVLGRPLTDEEWLDEIGEQTNSEVTIFSGNVRVNTTLKNSDGTRVVGTTMADNIASQVLDNGKSYSGTANLLGEKHFVCYHPLNDVNKQIVGAVFAGVSADDATAAETALLVTMIIVSLVIALAASALIVVIVVKVIINPIKEANKLSDDMSEGYLTRPASNFKFANDEIGDFVRNLEATKSSLNMYIGDISHVLAVMSTGDFTVNPGVEYIGDFKEIRNSFQGIKSALYDIVIKIQQSTTDVRDGASQISEAAQVLADGTTKQAASIEELSASINDIAGKVQSSSSNAEEASKISVLSTEKITFQNSEVENMLQAMEEIKSKSDQIQNIIAAIDGIAFQTNILALNAAVEAARAGAAGKGFAVVADEVRNLASKSAEASANTAALIENTLKAVENGTSIAGDTAQSLTIAVEGAQEVVEAVGKISRASASQADAVSQVTIGIDQISSVVQTNSATAEESAAASEELSGQAQMLKDLVSEFKLKDSHGSVSYHEDASMPVSSEYSDFMMNGSGKY